MSYCKEEGKDRIIFATKEDHDERSKAAYLLEEDDDDDEPGLINKDGSINWNCPCLGGMATGPCGPEFREAFSCFHYSTEEPKGSDCLETFKAMQDCMGQYPSLYPRRDEDEDDEGTEDILELDAEKDSGKNSESKNIEKSGSEGGEADESHEKSSSKSSDQGKS